MHIWHLNFTLCSESLSTVLCSWRFVPCFLIAISNFYGKCGFNSVPSRPSASFSTDIVSKQETNSWGKIHTPSVSLIKPSVTSLAGRNANSFQLVEANYLTQSCQPVILSFAAKLPFSQLVLQWICLQQKCLWQSLKMKILDTLSGHGPHTFPSPLRTPACELCWGQPGVPDAFTGNEESAWSQTTGKQILFTLFRQDAFP